MSKNEKYSPVGYDTIGRDTASQATYRDSNSLIRIFPTGENTEKNKQVLQGYLYEYLETRKLENLSKHWLYQIRQFVLNYLKYCNYTLSRGKTIAYLNAIREKYHPTTFRKREYQIRRFLRYLDLDYMEKVKIIPEPSYRPIRVDKKKIEQCLNYFEWRKYGLQAKALIMLGYDTGLRSSELYKLKKEDINLKSRTIELRSAKTGKERIVFFTPLTKRILKTYFKFFEERGNLKHLFGKEHCRRMFSESPLKIKMLRKAFAQRFIKQGGNLVALKQILGHSLKSDVTMSHYVLLSAEELKQEYDKVMS